MKINKEVLKIAFIYILILIVIASAFYYLGYVNGFNYSSDYYLEEYANCICNYGIDTPLIY